MKITAETKFNKDQEVFVVWGNQIVDGTIKEAELIGGWFGPAVQYVVKGYFKVGKYRAHTERHFGESQVFGTKQEAVVELNRQRKTSIDQGIQDAKHKICDVARGWKLCDCQTSKQEKIVRTLKKWNTELCRMIKEIDKE